MFLHFRSMPEAEHEGNCYDTSLCACLHLRIMGWWDVLVRILCIAAMNYCDILTIYEFRWWHKNKSHGKEQKKGWSLGRVQSQHMKPMTSAKLVWKQNGKEDGCSWWWPAFPWYCVQFDFICVQPVCRRRFWNVVQYPESWTSPPRRSWRNSAWNRKCSSRGGVWRVRMATVNFVNF